MVVLNLKSTPPKPKFQENKNPPREKKGKKKTYNTTPFVFLKSAI